MNAPYEYDVFVSYARQDNRHGAITHLVDEIRAIYAKRTKRPLRAFFDQLEIQTAQIWEERISRGLRTSAVLLAVVTEAYLDSRWCEREWDFFASLERALPIEIDQRLIFQVCPSGLPAGAEAPPSAQKWLRGIRSRQSEDLSAAGPEPDAAHDHVSRLTDDLIDGIGQASLAAHVAARDIDVQHQDVVAGYVRDGLRFVHLMARAINVTIVGMTNEGLATMLEDALARKRAAANRPDAFWESLRIVFLSEKLLHSLKDERSEYPDPAFELSQRELAAGYGKRKIEGFLKRSGSTKWQLYESQYYTPLVGALLEMPDGAHVVQQIVRRPQRSTPDHLFQEFEDRPDQYFTATFEDIVHNSSVVNRIVPVGVPAGQTLVCTGARFLKNVLVDGSEPAVWIPTVLVVTWWNRAGRAEPVVQLRTESNSSRELERVSHLAGYIYLDEASDPSPVATGKLTGFELPRNMADAASRDRIRMETGSTPPSDPKFISTQQYLHSDKEHLFFYVYSLELTGHFQFPQRAQMFQQSVDRLLAIRKNQTLRHARTLFSTPGAFKGPNTAAAEIIAQNLILHDLGGLAEELMSADSDPAEAARKIKRLTQLEKRSTVRQRSGAAEIELRGLSGLQYREFFTMLLPLYSELGITGASDHLSALRSSEAKACAVKRLQTLYNDYDVATSLPVEL